MAHDSKLDYILENAALNTSNDKFDYENLEKITKHFNNNNWLDIIGQLIDNNESNTVNAFLPLKEQLLNSIYDFAKVSGILKLKEIEESQYQTNEIDDHYIETDNEEEEGIKKKTKPMYNAKFSGFELIQNYAKYAPLRLSYEERELLHLLDSTLYIAEYTNSVDFRMSCKNAKKIIVSKIKNICSILSGLIMSRDFREGQQLLRDKNFADYSTFFTAIFEIGRRYKILNPSKFKSSYGQLVYLLMDMNNPKIAETLGFDCQTKIKTVYDFAINKKNGLLLFQDMLFIKSVGQIYEEGLSQEEYNSLIKKKDLAVKELIKKYATIHVKKSTSTFEYLKSFFPSNVEHSSRYENSDKLLNGSAELSADDIELIVYSIRDYITFQRFSAKPVEKIYQLLLKYFSDNQHNKPSLAIHAGHGGARLNHSHDRQFKYVKQSLALWMLILQNFNKLWILADQELLDSNNPYVTMDTGQGFQRVQSARSVLSEVQKILRSVEKDCGGWVGSTAIHIGDRTVPNVLVFIDKYLQVPQIISPLIHVFDQLEKLYGKNEDITLLINHSWGTPEKFIIEVLTDFFKHAFDGSGADNFYDAGSCIDGRLTSCWNWCNVINKKKYYGIFLLCGFIGFNMDL